MYEVPDTQAVVYTFGMLTPRFQYSAVMFSSLTLIQSCIKNPAPDPSPDVVGNVPMQPPA